MINSKFVPDHVPHHLVRNFSLRSADGMNECPHSTLAKLHEGPRVFWTTSDPTKGGAWVITRAKELRAVLLDTKRFSSQKTTGFSALIEENWDLIPLELDPPNHTRFRKLLNPLLSPPAVAKMANGVSESASILIEKIHLANHCEFIEDFAIPFPVGIFMQLMGLPKEMTASFLAWETGLLHTDNIEKRKESASQILSYLRQLIDERRACPTDDLTSFIVTAMPDGLPLSDDEIVGILFLLFIGGLDTVTSSLGFFFKHLAEDLMLQEQLRANPKQIPAASEEFFRRFSVVSSHRQAMADIDLGGAPIRKGDWVLCPHALGSLDPDQFSDPLALDIERKNVRHFAFAFGPHFCIGQFLARREIEIAMAEWLARIPTFRVDPNNKIKVHGGGVFGVDKLPLIWI